MPLLRWGGCPPPSPAGLEGGPTHLFLKPGAYPLPPVLKKQNNLATLPRGRRHLGAQTTAVSDPNVAGRWQDTYLALKANRGSPPPPLRPTLCAAAANYHRLYGALVDALALKELETLVLATTYSACKALLASEKVRTSSSERTLLKNLRRRAAGV